MRALSVFLMVAAVACGARTGLDAADGGGGGDGTPELCNGVDDDHDGQIDEGLGDVSCGLGACRVQVPACDHGAPSACVPGPPSAESCNGLDDDCDGATDEELGFDSIRGPFTVAVGPYFGSSVLTATGAGLLVATTHATDPVGASDASVFALPIDLDGQPLGPETHVFKGALWGPSVVATAEGRAMFTTCVPVGSESRAGSRLTDTLGAPLAEPAVRAPADRSCGAGWPAVAFTGERTLFAWIDNSSGPVEGFEVLLDVADASGGPSLGARTLYPNGDLTNGSPAFAMGEGAVGLAFAVRELGSPHSQMWLGRLDPTGADVGAPRVLEPADETVAFGAPALVPRAQGGFVLVAGDRFSGGLYGAPFGAELDGPSALPRIGGFDDRIVSSVSAAPRPGGGSVVAAASYAEVGFTGAGFVAALDDDGGVTHQWESPDPDEAFLYGASVAIREGRVFVAYLVVHPETTEVRLREFGCVPGR